MMTVAELCSRQVPPLDNRELKQFVKFFLERRDEFLQAARDHGSPLYLIDGDRLVKRANLFKATFARRFERCRVYYALKSNSHPLIARKLLDQGIHLDVSSGLELRTALDLGATDIIFSGPGKTEAELKLAVDNQPRVRVLIDSFGELGRLEQIAADSGQIISAGVRLTTDDSGIWRKFGIPLDRLPDFFKRASGCSHVKLEGIQFHLSWNLNPEAQVMFITRLGGVVRRLEQRYRDMIEFIDIGGGFWPEQGEWLQPAATPSGILQSAIGDTNPTGLDHFKRPASSLKEFADHIANALELQLPSSLRYTLCLEPGRWLSHESMHILLTVIDVKQPDVVITDGGTNAIGWDRFETDYFPVINLSRPSLHEHECLIAGSLCTPHDLWGYNYFGEEIKEGDMLLIPNQGAYTWSLRQEFIKPLPEAVELSRRDLVSDDLRLSSTGRTQ